MKLQPVSLGSLLDRGCLCVEKRSTPLPMMARRLGALSHRETLRAAPRRHSQAQECLRFIL